MQAGERSWTTTTNLSGVDHGPTWMTGTSPVIKDKAVSACGDEPGHDGNSGCLSQRQPAQGVGASLLRKEDDRFLRGRGQFVGDIRLPDMHASSSPRT